MIRLSIARPVAAAMAYLAVALLGVAAWRQLPIELLPDTQLPRLTITAFWPGASPEMTEAFVTAPIEAEIQQIRGVERIESVSSEVQGQGQARITVEFARGTDMNFARLEISERMRALDEDLPGNASRPHVQQYVPQEIQRQERRFLTYTVTGPFTLEALRAYADAQIEPELAQVDGVSHVEVSGGRARLLEIELQDDQIRALGLSPMRVRQLVQNLEFIREAGVVNVGGSLHSLAIRMRAESVADVRRAVVLSDGGRLVRLGDVATVRDTYEEPRSHYRIDGRPAVSFEVFRRPVTNAVAVADRVKERVAELEPESPPGVRFILDEDMSQSIRAQLMDLRSRAVVAAVVIFVVLLIFLRSFRSAGIVFVTIAFSILITLNALYWSGLSLNVFTLMGLAMGFGLIVDNAIVVLENIYRHRRTGRPAKAAAEAGAREVVLPVLAATVTTLVVIVPFVYLQGELRIYYLPLGMVVGFSLLASLFVAFSFIPALAGRALRRMGTRAIIAPGGADVTGGKSGEGEYGGDDGRGGETEKGGESAEGGEKALADQPDATGAAVGFPVTTREPIYVRLYAALTGFTLRFPWVTVVIAALIFGGSYRLFDKHVTRGAIWRSWGGEQSYISIEIRLPRGEELARTDELVRYFEERLATMPEVGKFESRVQTTHASMRVTFPDSLERTGIPVAIKEQLLAYSYGFGGADVRVYGYGPSFYGGGGGAPNYSIQIKGYNYEAVRDIAEDLGRRLTRFSRIHEVDTNASGSWFSRDRATEIALEPDRARLAMHGLTVQDLVWRVRSAVFGSEGQASTVRVAGEQLNFSVKLSGHTGMDVHALSNLLVPAQSGTAVRVGDVATLREREVLAQIIRENQQYQRRVSYEFRGPSRLGDVVRDAVVDATRLPPGYSISTQNTWQWSVEEKQQIYGVLAIALLLVFMTTAALFESLRQPLCVLLTVPMALVGVFLIFFYANASFTREAYIGVIMMGGIVVNNAILLVDHINRLRREGGMLLQDAILRGTLDRVRPILMTSATTIFGLLPLVVFSGYADANIWNALGYALIGGLASSTIFVLTVTPAVYLLFERRAERRRLAREGTAASAGSAAVPELQPS